MEYMTTEGERRNIKSNATDNKQLDDLPPPQERCRKRRDGREGVNGCSSFNSDS